MMKLRWGALIIGLLLLEAAAHAQMIPDRRKDQFPKEFSYLVFPLPYSLPGIGSGVYLPVYAANVFGTYADAYALFITGDAAGSIYALDDVHLIEKHLIASVFSQNFSRASYTNYTLRGMDSKQDDFQIIEISKYTTLQSELRLTFWDRRIEFFGNHLATSNAAKAVRDPDGELIAKFSEPLEQEFTRVQYGGVLDFTDDRQDPRRGLRVVVTSQGVERNTRDEPEFTVVNTAVSVYLPLGKLSTLALHGFRSDALVSNRGDTNAATVRQRVSLNCDAGDAACQSAEDSQVNNTILHNRNGDAEALGGQNLLRAYSDGRFQGAHTLYYGAELRWNLTEEFTPFDYLIWRDVRTGVQLALFYEQGTASETVGALGDTWRSDVGVGLRMVTGSGAVFRADYAWGAEGGQPVVIVSYPF